MMWARSEFFGCAGARMFDGFLVTCYYHPSGNRQGESVFEQSTNENDVCTECPEWRASCSRVLTGLCGLDDEYILQSSGNILDVHAIFVGFYISITVSCFIT